jgi:DNA-binding LytR/AlgR family response regulator
VIVKLTIDENEEYRDVEIIIKCPEADQRILKLVTAIKSHMRTLVGSKDNKSFVLEFSDIYYIETVDDKVFIYLENDVYEWNGKQYEMESQLSGLHFQRISKQALVNLKKIKCFASAPNARILIELLNGEKLLVSRLHVPELKKILGL